MTIEDLFEKSLATWRANKAKGTEIIYSPIEPIYEVLLLLYKRLQADKNAGGICLIVPDYAERINVIKFFETSAISEDFKMMLSSRRIKIWTIDVYAMQTYKVTPELGILYKPKSINDIDIEFLSSCKWNLVILTNTLSNEEMVKLSKVSPLINGMTQQDIDKVLNTSPVEEIRIKATIPEGSEDEALLQKYDKYIEQSLNIFGSFEVLEQARVGNKQANVSAATICDNIARENGWHENLDMSVEFNVQIDNYYNPMNIMDRASNTYRIMRSRLNFLTDNHYKLEKILDIVKENINKKILIVSKRSEFAKTIRDSINSKFGNICGCWLSDLETIPATDLDGNPVYVKSGPNKGERKMYGAKMQSNQAETLFNIGRYNVLSISNAPDKSLAISVDVVIITSPMCEDIRNIQYRLSNTRFNHPITLYSIYLAKTSEQKRLLNKPITENHTIIKDCENDYYVESIYDESFVD